MTFAARNRRVQGWAGEGLGWASILDVSYDNAGSIESISIDFLFGVASDDSGVP